jgi:hypothetical protein
MVPCAMGRTDFIHLCLMLSALGLAYVVPFELLVLAYVVLGPAHYTTEISWLHERRYFVPHRGYAVALAAIALGAALISDAPWFGFVMWAALVLGALLVTPRTGVQGVVLVIAAIGLTAIFYMRSPAFAVIGVLLPTLIHVSIFTLIFMALGAWRARSAPQAGLTAVYLAAIALILFVPPTAATVIPRFATFARDYFGTVAQALGVLFGTRDIHLDTRLTGLLSFLYTYHYLNWFIKAEVIRWADIPRQRWLVIGTVSAASTGLYFYDAALGFSVLLALSLAHVVLEFPLNALAIRQLGAAAGNGLMTLMIRPHGSHARVNAPSGSARLRGRHSRPGRARQPR